MKSKLNYIFLGIIIILIVALLYSWFDLRVDKINEITALAIDISLLKSENGILNNKLLILENFLTMEFPKEVEEYKQKLNNE